MKRHAPATSRNRQPILAVLQKFLPPEGVVLEIASGSGEHAAYFAQHFPGMVWQPSDGAGDSLASIAAWRRESAADNLAAPLELDASADIWPLDAADAVFCANMIHISPWDCAVGLMRGAGRVLPPGGMLIVYGPFKQGGEHTAPSNAAFDSDLRQRDSRWGLRDLEAVNAQAQAAGLDHVETIAMPANNLCVVWRKRV